MAVGLALVVARGGPVRHGRPPVARRGPHRQHRPAAARGHHPGPPPRRLAALLLPRPPRLDGGLRRRRRRRAGALGGAGGGRAAPRLAGRAAASAGARRRGGRSCCSPRRPSPSATPPRPGCTRSSSSWCSAASWPSTSVLERRSWAASLAVGAVTGALLLTHYWSFFLVAAVVGALVVAAVRARRHGRPTPAAPGRGPPGAAGHRRRVAGVPAVGPRLPLPGGQHRHALGPAAPAARCPSTWSSSSPPPSPTWPCPWACCSTPSSVLGIFGLPAVGGVVGLDLRGRPPGRALTLVGGRHPRHRRRRRAGSPGPPSPSATPPWSSPSSS